MDPTMQQPGLLQMLMSGGGYGGGQQRGGGMPLQMLQRGAQMVGAPNYGGNRAPQAARGNMPAPNPMQPTPGGLGGPGPDPRAPSPPAESYDPNAVQGAMGPGMAMGMRRPMMRPMLGRGTPPAAGLQIGNRAY